MNWYRLVIGRPKLESGNGKWTMIDIMTTRHGIMSALMYKCIDFFVLNHVAVDFIYK